MGYAETDPMKYIILTFTLLIELAALGAFVIFLGVCAGLYTGVIQ